MINKNNYSVSFPDSERKKAERIAALLELEHWYQSFSVGMYLALEYAESHIKGKTEPVFCTPKVAALIKDNEKFIDALCEEGVVEWLTEFVLTKSHLKQKND